MNAIGRILELCDTCSYDPEQFAGTHTPILVIGTKLDQAQVVRENALKRSSSIAEECGADEINLVRINYKSCILTDSR